MYKWQPLSTNNPFLNYKICSMKLLIGILAMLLPVLSGAQPALTSLTIGDTVPGVIVSNVYNYPASAIRLSDLKGKLIILDFWGTWCGACIESFPEMHKLKKEFGDNLQLLFIDRDTNETETKVSAFFRKRKLRTGQYFEFPYVLHDTTFINYFPNTSVPHCVWLDSSLKVVAITGKEEVTAANIQKFLSGIPLSLPVKNDALAFNPQNSLLNGNINSPGDFIYRSVLTRYREGLGNTIGKSWDKNKNISRMYIINYSLFLIFRMAYPEVLKYGAGRTFIEAKDSLLYMRPANDDLVKKNLFCYEIITPPVPQPKITAYLRSDLLRCFHTIARNEMRPVNCYIVTANKLVKSSITAGGSRSSETGKESLHKYFTNVPVAELTAFLNTLLDRPVVDETGITQHIDIELPQGFYNYSREEMISFFYRCGFTLTPASKVMEVAVISDSEN